MLIDLDRDAANTPDLYEPPPTHPLALGAVLAVLVLACVLSIGWWIGAAGFGEVARAAPKVAVPDVVGMTESAARAAIERAGLEAEIVPVRNVEVPAGTAFRQDPGYGLEVDSGTTVVIEVSGGDAFVLVPEITGTSEDALADQLEQFGLVVGSVSRREDSTSLAGEVLQQTPPPGQEVALGSAVDVVISEGPPPVEVPDVVGLTQAEATRELIELGFTVTPVRIYSAGRVGNVVGTNPRADTMADFGASIRLFVSRGAAPTTVPPPPTTEPETTTPTTAPTPTTPTTPPTTPEPPRQPEPGPGRGGGEGPGTAAEPADGATDP